MFALVLVAGLFARPDLADLDARPCPTRAMRIPFTVDLAARPTVRLLRLFASVDRGRTWYPVVEAGPGEGSFQFYAPTPGLYWLAVQTVTADGKASPTAQQLRPDLKVLVLAPPTVSASAPRPAPSAPIAPPLPPALPAAFAAKAPPTPPAPLPPSLTDNANNAELRRRIAELERRLAAVEGRVPAVPSKIVNHPERP